MDMCSTFCIVENKRLKFGKMAKLNVVDGCNNNFLKITTGTVKERGEGHCNNSNEDQNKMHRLLLKVNPRKIVARVVAVVMNILGRRYEPAVAPLQFENCACTPTSKVSATGREGGLQNVVIPFQKSCNDAQKIDFPTVVDSIKIDDDLASTKLEQRCKKQGTCSTPKSPELNFEKCTDTTSCFFISKAFALSHFKSFYYRYPVLPVANIIENITLFQHQTNSSCDSSFSPVVTTSKLQTRNVFETFTKKTFFVPCATPHLCECPADESPYGSCEEKTFETDHCTQNESEEKSISAKLSPSISSLVDCDETPVTSVGECSLIGPTLLSGSFLPYVFDQGNQSFPNDTPRRKDANENQVGSAEATTEYASSLALLVLPPLGKEFDFTLCGYEHLSVLARGQFGCTHIVRKLKDNTEWVAKVIDLEEFAADEIAFIRREASYLRRLQHPYIVQYHDSFETDSSLVIVMENCTAGDLFTTIRAMRKRHEYFSEEQILKWFNQIVLGLQYMHSQRILHCDLKTTNIFLTSDGVAKIGDFGIARELGECGKVLNPEEFPRGTPLYMSPEMCKNLPLSNKSDCWSLGCVLYEICCLRHAFDGCCAYELLKSIEHNISAVGASVPAGYSPFIVSLISNLLRQEPEDRASLKDIIKMLNNHL